MYCDWPALRRCCFCMPLRRGVLVFAYLNLLYSGFMITAYSFALHNDLEADLGYTSMSVINLPSELCILVYSIEMCFNALLIYGAHKKINKFVKAYYAYAVSTTLATVLLFVLEVAINYKDDSLPELVVFGFAGFFIQVYLLILVWSLLKKLVEDGPNAYENQLHQVINGQTEVATHGVV